MMQSKPVALVTGGSQGIGLAIAVALRDAGYHTIATARHLPNEAIKGIEFRVSDVSKTQDRKDLLETIRATYGRLDLLVNNAGIAPRVRADVLQTSEESFDEVLSINLKAVYFLCQGAGKLMAEQKSGCIINISSISADTVSLMRGEYCVSKAGASMVTQLFAARLAECGIPVYEIRPGIINTPMTEGVKEKYDALLANGLAPIARWGEGEDVARAVCLLASGQLPYSTGEVLHVDGGMHIKRL